MLGDTCISCGHTADFNQGNTELPRVKLSKVNSSLVSFYLGQKILIDHTTMGCLVKKDSKDWTEIISNSKQKQLLTSCSELCHHLRALQQ